MAAVPAPAKAAAPKAPERKRARARATHESGGPVAAWLNLGERPRPSSFIPAPPRAESAFGVAAPPASSDRLVRPGDVAALAFRTFPVRVEIEQGGGRTFVSLTPPELFVRAGDGIEWDFRYLAGSDVVVSDIVVEFAKPSPFPKASLKSQKPGGARPHRLIAGPAAKDAVGRRGEYVVRCFDMFKTQVATTSGYITITA